MGLKLNFEDQYGYTGEYIRIGQLYINFAAHEGRIELEFWKDRKTSQNKRLKPVAIHGIAITETTVIIQGKLISLAYEDVADKTRAQLYNTLKAHKLNVKMGNVTRAIDLSIAEDIFE